jgi:hypothetical protein
VELDRVLAATVGLATAAAADLGLVLPLVESSRSYIGFSSENAASSPMGMVIESGGKSGSGSGGGGIHIRGGEASPLPPAMTVSHDTFLSPAPAPAPDAPHTRLSRSTWGIARAARCLASEERSRDREEWLLADALLFKILMRKMGEAGSWLHQQCSEAVLYTQIIKVTQKMPPLKRNELQKRISAICFVSQKIPVPVS